MLSACIALAIAQKVTEQKGARDAASVTTCTALAIAQKVTEGKGARDAAT